MIVAVARSSALRCSYRFFIAAPYQGVALNF
jgi:hypothetical protein